MKNKPTFTQTIREAIVSLGAVQDVSKTLKKFDKLQVKEPKSNTAFGTLFV